MVKKRTGMGNRGLSVMLSAKQKSEATETQETRVDKLPIDKLQPGTYQPRAYFAEQALQELSDSIKVQGVVQPLVVRAVDAGKYEIIAGERRWRASQQAGLSEVPVVIRNVDAQTALAMALIENIQREDLSPLETARGLERMQEEFSLKQSEIAELIGRSRSSVTNLLRLLKLPAEIQQQVDEGLLSMGHARAIISLNKTQQQVLAAKAIEQGWSVRRIEEEAAKLQLSDEQKPKKKSPVPHQFEREEGTLQRYLSAPVKISQNDKGRGKIEIAYGNQEELTRLLALIRP